MSEGKIFLAVIMVMAVLVTNVVSTQDVMKTICNYKICSSCCNKAIVHCRKYCKNMQPSCNMADPNVCDVHSRNVYFTYSFKAKGCDTCKSKKRTLENVEPSSIMSSPDTCSTCVQRALKSYQGTNPSVWVRQVCADVCL